MTSRVAASIVAAMLLSGCTADAPGDTADDAPTATLVACVVPTPQLVEAAADGGFDGFDVAVLEHVAEALETQLELVEITFDELVSGIALNGMECEIGAGGVVEHEELDAVVTPSAPYRDVDRLVVGVGVDEQLGPDAVTGAVGYVEGGVAADAVDGLPGAELVPYPSLTDLERGIGTGEQPAWLVTVGERDQLAVSSGVVLDVVSRVPSGDATVLLLPLGADQDRREAVDTALADLLETPAYAALRERWLDA